MKHRVCSNLTIALGLSLVGFSAYSAHTIYGLSNASHYQSGISKDIYIQLGSFKNKLYAEKARHIYQRQTNHPVKINKKDTSYVVYIGPLHSAAEVRSTAKYKAQPVKQVVYTKPEIKQQPIEDPIISANYYNKKYHIVATERQWFIGVGGGWMSPFGTAASNFASSGMPGFPDDRYTNDSSHGAGQYSIFAGRQWQRSTKWLPAYSLALQYTYTDAAAINGFIFVNNLPDTKNFTYQYHVSQHLPMVKLKLDLYQWQRVMPYISGSLGAAINRGHNYSDAPIPGATQFHRRYGFNAATTTQFAGTFGVGLDVWITKKSQLSLGYELSYFNNVKTGNGQDVLSANSLGNRINANAVILQGTYFCDGL